MRNERTSSPHQSPTEQNEESFQSLLQGPRRSLLEFWEEHSRSFDFHFRRGMFAARRATISTVRHAKRSKSRSNGFVASVSCLQKALEGKVETKPLCVATYFWCVDAQHDSIAHFKFLDVDDWAPAGLVGCVVTSLGLTSPTWRRDFGDFLSFTGGRCVFWSAAPTKEERIMVRK